MRLDPRSPLVVNTHDLGRRPGVMRERTLSLPAPVDLRVELMGVRPGSPVEMDIRLESVLEGVLVSGAAQVTLTGECARCLGPIEDDLEVALQELYVYPESDAEEDEAARLDGDLLDLEPVLRDAVVLALPFRPVCRADCPGLCVDCGARLADDSGHQHAESVDPRWLGLAALQAGPTVLADSTAPSDQRGTKDQLEQTANAAALAAGEMKE
ncbi:MAG: YceD family protein [Nocardioidaceae bacterium]